jgi:hypothetical protein
VWAAVKRRWKGVRINLKMRALAVDSARVFDLPAK